MSLNDVWAHSDVSSKPSFVIKSSRWLWYSPQLLCLVLILCNHEVFQVTNRRCFQQTLAVKGSSCTECKISHSSELSTTLFSAQFGCSVNDGPQWHHAYTHAHTYTSTYQSVTLSWKKHQSKAWEPNLGGLHFQHKYIVLPIQYLWWFLWPLILQVWILCTTGSLYHGIIISFMYVNYAAAGIA